jgi:hypothetical protein
MGMTDSAAVLPARAGDIIDELFACLSRGDVAGARGCCTPDARVWHSFDGVALSLDQACAGWQLFVTTFPERSVVDVRRAAIPGGFVQQHLLIVRRTDGARRGWPICIVFKIREGRIASLEEYIDRSGALPLDEGERATPGLVPAVPADYGVDTAD